MEQTAAKGAGGRGVGSRRKCEELIAAGRVTVDGKVVTEMGIKVDPEKSEIAVGGKRVNPFEEKVYVLLNKPRGTRARVRIRTPSTPLWSLLRDVKTPVYRSVGSIWTPRGFLFSRTMATSRTSSPIRLTRSRRLMLRCSRQVAGGGVAGAVARGGVGGRQDCSRQGRSHRFRPAHGGQPGRDNDPRGAQASGSQDVRGINTRCKGSFGLASEMLR